MQSLQKRGRKLVALEKISCGFDSHDRTFQGYCKNAYKGARKGSSPNLYGKRAFPGPLVREADSPLFCGMNYLDRACIGTGTATDTPSPMAHTNSFFSGASD